MLLFLVNIKMAINYNKKNYRMTLVDGEIISMPKAEFDPNQLWYLVPTAIKNEFRIINAQTNNCLDSRGTHPYNLKLEPCVSGRSGSNAHQIWIFDQ
jgi:hypothetical protein